MKIAKSVFTAGCILAVSGVLPTHAKNPLWGTYFGGLSEEKINAVATDSFGQVYVVGQTKSIGIATADAFDAFKDQAGIASGFLAKFDSTGKPVWVTYYGDQPGGTDDPVAELVDVKLDTAGNAYVLGHIRCPSVGLATPGAFQATCNGEGRNLYLAKFDPAGHRLWGTYYGGDVDEWATALSVTSNGLYVVADTSSPQGVVTLPSADSSYGGHGDALIAKFDLSGHQVWSRYYGGERTDDIYDIECGSNICFVTGQTSSDSAIVTAGAHQAKRSGKKPDAFLARINAGTGDLAWGTYFGGPGTDAGISLTVDHGLNVYVGGNTDSETGIAPLVAFKTTLGGQSDAFIAKFTGNGALNASTYLGEGALPSTEDEDHLLDLAKDAAGNIYALTLADWSPVFGDQATPNAFDKIAQGPEAVITKFNGSLARVWGTYYGGAGLDVGSGIAIGLDNHVHVGGRTSSTDGIATPGSHKTSPDGTDAFLVEFSL